MDGSTDRAWLDWWANPSTRLGSAEVYLDVDATTAGHDARARLVATDAGAIEEFEFLCLLDPVFSLRLADGATIPVRVEATPSRGQVTLHEYDRPKDRPIGNRLDL